MQLIQLIIEGDWIAFVIRLAEYARKTVVKITLAGASAVMLKELEKK